MCRFASRNGPLSLAAVCGRQSTLLCFDVDEHANHLLHGLVGFAISRTQDQNQDGVAETIWFGDPRRGKWSEDTETASATAVEVVDEHEAPEEPRPLGGGWRRALRCAIQDFKWGDYTTQPSTRYRYRLCAISGDPQLGVESWPSEGPPTCGPGLHVVAQVEMDVCTPAADSDSHQVFFNRGVAGSQRFARLSTGTKESGPRSPEQWQWLSNGLEEAMLSFISQAHQGYELRCAFYEAHYPPVLRALAAAQRRGADVQIVMDWKPAGWSEERKVWTQRGPQHMNYWALAESGLLNSGSVFYRTRPLTAISHNKFMILASPGGEKSVWTGSTNITAGAIFGHSNVGQILAQPQVCQKYLSYWEKLIEDPDKKDIAKFNEELSPLPEDREWTELVLFSPRLRWADALSFMAQLILKARHSVAFTAAFGISREISPALLAAGSEGAGAPVPTYLLLESQGNWQASRDAVQALQRKSNVRVAFGMHMEVPPNKPQPSGGAWIPETLTGLNEHVRYVHTKILLIDMFSDDPIVVSGSGNFSRASFESNDENVVVVRGNQNMSDAYSVEFFRMFEHMRFRNEVQGTGKHLEAEPDGDAKADLVMCRCGQAVAEKTVKKAGPNVGRKFRCCANPQRLSCGYFAWVESEEKKETIVPEEPWPQCCYSNTFATLERRLMKDLLGAACTEPGRSEEPAPATQDVGSAAGSSCASFATADEGMLELWDLCGLSEGPAELKMESDCKPEQNQRPNMTEIRNAAMEMLAVSPKVRGSSKRLNELRDHLVTCVRSLPDDPLREPLLERLHEMRSKLSFRSQESWQPQLRQVVDLLS